MCLLKKKKQPSRSGLCLARLNLKSSWSHHLHRAVCLLCGHLCLTQCAWLCSAGHSQPRHGYASVLRDLPMCTCTTGSPEPGMSCPGASRVPAVVQVQYLHHLRTAHRSPGSSVFLRALILN